MRQNILKALSELIARSSLASRAGMTFGNERDLFKALGYKRDLTLEDYRERFERNGIAARVVDALPKATWRNGASIIEDEDPESSTKFEEEWETFEERLNVWSVLMRADILAGLGRYSVVLIGAPGEMHEPIEKLKSLDEIAYLSPYSERDTPVESIDEKENSPRFGMPDFYTFKRLTAITVGKAKGALEKKVHHSRVLHIADGVLDELIYGLPRMKNVWNYCDDLEKVSGSGSEAYWLRVHPGTQFNIDPEVEMNPAQLEELKDQVDEYTHQMRRVLRTRGVEINQLGSDVSPFSAQVDSILSLISGSTGIPKRILVGSEMGHLASTQDRNNWHERIEDRRTEFADPWIIRPLIDRFLEWGAMTPADSYEVRWPHIQKLDEKDRAAIASQLDKVSEKIITKAEVRDRILDLPPLEEVIDLENDEIDPETGLPIEEKLEDEIDPETGLPVVAQRKKLLKM